MIALDYTQRTGSLMRVGIVATEGASLPATDEALVEAAADLSGYDGSVHDVIRSEDGKRAEVAVEDTP